MQEADRTRGEVIREAREAKPWTQAQLAEAAGVSTRTIMRVERDEETSAETLLSLCAALDILASALPRPVRSQDPGQAAPQAAEMQGSPMAQPSRPVDHDERAYPASEPVSPSAPWAEPAPLTAKARRVLVICSMVLSLTVIGVVTGLQLAWSAVAPHTVNAAEAMQALIASSRSRQLNMLSVRYSTLVPPDSPDRKWEIWQEDTHLSWSSCDQLGEGVLSGYVRFLSALTPGDKGCVRTRLDLNIVRRDDAMTEAVVGPLDPKYMRGLLSSLTGDPSVRIQAIRTPDGSTYSEYEIWADPRTTQIDSPDGKPSYARIRFSGTR